MMAVTTRTPTAAKVSAREVRSCAFATFGRDLFRGEQVFDWPGELLSLDTEFHANLLRARKLSGSLSGSTILSLMAPTFIFGTAAHVALCASAVFFCS